MSIKFKLPLLVLLAFFINLLLLGGYYRFFFSKQISQYYNQYQVELQRQADQISSELKDVRDLGQGVNDISKRMNLYISIEDESGNIVFHSNNKDEINLERSAASLLRRDNHIYLLRVTQFIMLANLSSFEVARTLLGVEMIIIYFVLIFIGIILYFKYVKPIIILQRNIEDYRSGIHPQKVIRDDEIGLLQNEFVDLTDTIEEERQKQNRMIASISHDIKTPLTSVMGYAERLKKSTLSADRFDLYIDTIYNKAVSIKNLIDEFDEYLSYHIQSDLKRQMISVEKLCNILRLDYQEELKERNINFSVNSDCQSEMLSIDISKIRRVFGNAISNSLKHFAADKPFIDVFCHKSGDDIIFSIEDNGTGIESDEDLKRAFDPFYTSDKGRSVAGLGLSICKEIIEAHGGRIWGENKKDGGFCLQFRLPIFRTVS